jgi:type I restriction enzyme S subunit|tara:strand:- start:823 stop:2022 length:1200 start_codon:yes stop_codon:yes gene_type:complete
MTKELTMEKTRLPDGWEMKTLGEVSIFSQGIQVGLKKHISNPKDGYVRFIRIVDYTQNTLDIRYVPNPGEKYFVNEDDIVMVRYGSPGLIGRGKSGVIANNLFRIKINIENLTNDYLSLFLSQYKIQKYLSSQGSATMPALNFGQLKTVNVLYPKSIEQQKQIVSTLDKAFAAIATAKTNAEKNLQNAKELFESYLQNVFSTKGNDWEEKTIGDLGKPSMCKRILKKQTSDNGDIPFYKIGTFGKTPNAFISKELYEEYKTKYSFPKKGDILISASGTIGRRVIYDGKPAFFQDSNIVWIDNDEKQVLNDYLYSFYGFCDWQPSKGATISRLYNANLKRIKISFPKSLLEQKIVIQKIEVLSNETKKLEAIYTQKIADLDEMKKSVLQKAFSGKLKINS